MNTQNLIKRADSPQKGGALKAIVLITVLYIGMFLGTAALAEVSDNSCIGGLHCDIGLGAERFSDGYVSRASIDANREVSVAAPDKFRPTLWANVSWLATAPFGIDCSTRYWCIGGVYAGLRLTDIGDGDKSESGVLNAISAGIVLFSFKAGSDNKSGVDSLYVGFGPVLHKGRKLSRGLSDGDTLPDALSELQYDESYRKDWMINIGIRVK